MRIAYVVWNKSSPDDFGLIFANGDSPRRMIRCMSYIMIFVRMDEKAPARKVLETAPSDGIWRRCIPNTRRRDQISNISNLGTPIWNQLKGVTGVIGLSSLILCVCKRKNVFMSCIKSKKFLESFFEFAFAFKLNGPNFRSHNVNSF